MAGEFARKTELWLRPRLLCETNFSFPIVGRRCETSELLLCLGFTPREFDFGDGSRTGIVTMVPVEMVVVVVIISSSFAVTASAVAAAAAGNSSEEKAPGVSLAKAVDSAKDEFG